MPELPELQALSESLTAEVAGRRITRAVATHPAVLKTADPPLEDLRDARLSRVERRGKLLVVATDAELSLVIHLMSAGRFGLRDADRATGRQTVLRLELDDGRALALRELGTKRRASAHLIAGDAVEEHPQIARLGPEPLGLDPDGWRRAIGEPRARLHTALRDGRRVAGIGRCYASEIMWAARLAPFAMTTGLPDDSWSALARAADTVLEQATERCREAGVLDMPQREKRTTAVHRHAGEPCLRCGAELARVSFSEYELVYCPDCQSGGRRYADRRLSRLNR